MPAYPLFQPFLLVVGEETKNLSQRALLTNGEKSDLCFLLPVDLDLKIELVNGPVSLSILCTIAGMTIFSIEVYTNISPECLFKAQLV